MLEACLREACWERRWAPLRDLMSESNAEKSYGSEATGVWTAPAEEAEPTATVIPPLED